MHTGIGPQIRAEIDKICSADISEWVLDGSTYAPDDYNDVLIIDGDGDRILKFTYDPETDTVETYTIASRVHLYVEQDPTPAQTPGEGAALDSIG